MAEIIRLEGIFFGYNASPLLKGIDLDLWEGERIGISGPNGAGKTSLFYLIMGFLRPLAGKVILFGKERKEERDFAEVRARLGLLFQNAETQLFCPTVEEDIAFGPLNLGRPRKEVQEKVQAIAHYLGIEKLLKRPVHKLSGGEKRLVSLAGLMAMEPACYLLDEPTLGLDEKGRTRLLTWLKNEPTYVIISHELTLLKELCHKVYWLEEGRLSPLKL